MRKALSYLLVGFLAVTIVGCGKSLNGERYVSIDGSDWIQFVDGGRFETTLEKSILEGEYRLEDDDRIRLSISLLGVTEIAYATRNDDGGLTIAFSADERQRFFKADDPKLQAALKPAETLIETQARYCHDARCMGILPPVRDIAVSNVDVVYDERLTVPFAKIPELELVDGRRGRTFSVAARVTGDSLRDAMHGGWTEFRFAGRKERDAFYNKLGAALQDWHSKYGATDFAYTPVATAVAATASESTGSAAYSAVPASAGAKVQKEPETLVGTWREMNSYGPGRYLMVFSDDETWAVSDAEKGEVVQQGRYHNASPAVLEMWVYKPDGKLAGPERQSYSFDEGKLVLGNDEFMRVTSVNDVPRDSIPEQVESGFGLAAMAKIGVSEVYAKSGVAPNSNAEAGLPAGRSGTYVDQVSVTAGGVIEVTYGANASEEIAGKKLYVKPILAGGRVAWDCYVDTALVAYAPDYCAQEVESQYLPTPEQRQRRSRQR